MELSANALKESASALAKLVAKITGKAVADVEGYAREYAPAAAAWGVKLAQAEANNDAVAIERLEEDFKQLSYLAAAQAGSYGIEVQGAAEGAFQTALRAVATFAPLLL